MKTYFKSKEIEHYWAHELAPRGKCPSSVSFEGPSYYSYGTEIGRIIKRNGRKAYLLNITHYSITTSGHQGALRAAIPKTETIFQIGNIGMGCWLELGNDKQTGNVLFDFAIQSAADAALKLSRARKEWQKNHYAATQADWIRQAEQVSAFFGLRRKVDNHAIERLQARIMADAKRQAKIKAEVQKRREQEAKKAIARWLAGDRDVFYQLYNLDKVYLRAGMMMSRDNGEPDTPSLETSKGVTVPLAEAKRAYLFAQRVRATGWRRNGETFRVGEFQLDAVNEFGIIAGCHRIDWETAEAFAKTQGWTI